MTSCYDCEHFGIECRGIVPPMDFKDRVNELCRRFEELRWHDQLYKPAGSTIL